MRGTSPSFTRFDSASRIQSGDIGCEPIVETIPAGYSIRTENCITRSTHRLNSAGHHQISASEILSSKTQIELLPSPVRRKLNQIPCRAITMLPSHFCWSSAKRLPFTSWKYCQRIIWSNACRKRWNRRNDDSCSCIQSSMKKVPNCVNIWNGNLPQHFSSLYDRYYLISFVLQIFGRHTVCIAMVSHMVWP